MTELNDLEKRTLTIKKTFNAPRTLVWEAWTQPEHIANWWGPKGMKTKIEKHDFKVSGEWEYSMTMPDGKNFISEGVFLKIVVPEFIETTANFKPMTEGVILEAHFIEANDKTEFIFKGIHPTEAYAKQQEKMGFFNGWGSVFSNLEVYVEGLV